MSDKQVRCVVVTPEKGPPAKATLKVIAKAATTDKTKNNERFMKILHQSEFEFQYFNISKTALHRFLVCTSLIIKNADYMFGGLAVFRHSDKDP